MKFISPFLVFVFAFIACNKPVQSTKERTQVKPKVFAPPVVKIAPEVPVIPSQGIPSPGSKPPQVNIAGVYSHMQNYNTKQGLCLSSIASGYLDRSGNLWFGTLGGGVSRYNGKTFTNFTIAQGLSNNVVLCIFEDKKGNVWFGTLGGGVSRYDGSTFKSYTSRHGLTNDFVWGITEDNSGNMWFATNGGGVSCFNGTKFKNYTTKEGLCSDFVWGITKDNEGNLWFATDDSGICCFNGQTFKSYSVTEGLIDNFVRSIYADSKGNIWCGTKKGVSYLNILNDKAGKKAIINYTEADGLAKNDVWCITEDLKGGMWFGTFGGGVSRLDYKGLNFSNFGKEQGLINTNIRSITCDNSGNLWFGTLGGGVYRYDGNAFSSYSQKQGLPSNYVRGIAQDNKDNLWFATVGGGISCFNGSSFTNYGPEQGFTNPTAWCVIQDRKGQMWFGSESAGVFVFDGTSFKKFNSDNGLSQDNVWCLYEDSKGNIWMGTNGGGVSCYDGTGFKIYTTDQGLGNNYVRSITEDKDGNIWFATEAGGASCFDGKTFRNYTVDQGLAKNALRCVMQDNNGNMWFGTIGGGVSIMRAGSNTISESYSSINGMSDDVVYDIVEDKKGNIVMGTNQGFTLLRGGLPKQGVDPTFEVFNNKSGYPVKDINSKAMFCDKKGVIWAGTGDDQTALVRFDLRELNSPRFAPQIKVQSIKLNNEIISWGNLSDTVEEAEQGEVSATVAEEVVLFGAPLTNEQRRKMREKFSEVKFSGIEKFYSLPNDLVIPYKHNNITFDFTAIEPSRPFLVQYQYMLEGYDKDWSPLSNKSEAIFGNISEGNYTFKLKAKGTDGYFSKTLSFTFTVLPPWYRTWWAYTLSGLIVVSLLWLIIKRREKSLVREKLILEEKIASRTSELQEQKEIAETQKHFIELKQKEILDSIKYAQRIQNALLASDKLLNQHFPEHFVMFKPKDLVSGDFYWATPTPEGFIYITADCTGHGVPGAFMSLLNISKLSQTINESGITRPDLIFNNVRTEIVNVLNPEGSNEESKDGMDAVLCKLDLVNMKLQYAAANNSFYIIRNNEKIVCKADKMPVGKSHDDTVAFKHNEINLEKGDVIYTFTDGFADQFGGPKGKKFKYKQLEALLRSICSEPMSRQKKMLEEAFISWKGELEQVDDVCIVGVRV